MSAKKLGGCSESLISVIIPFYSRGGAFKCTLLAFAEQSLEPKHFEIIVVDDGSSEDTRWIKRSPWPFHLRLVHQANRGPSAARNLGAKTARGKLLLFLDADIIPHPQLLSTHRQIHSEDAGVLVAGACLPWKGGPSPFIERIIEWEIGDTRQRYSKSLDGETIPIPFYDTATGNLSINRETFEHIGGFDQKLRGCEDVEFGYRAYTKGIRVVYAPKAIGYHNHSRKLEERLRRQWVYCSYKPLIVQKHPGIHRLIPSWLDEPQIDWRNDSPGLIRSKLKRRILASAPILVPMHSLAVFAERLQLWPRLLRFLYWRLIASYDYLGYCEGVQRCKRHTSRSRVT